MFTVRTIIILLFVARTIASPVSDTYITWQVEPNVRGTWSILSSCVATLVLCSYTAIHPDVLHAPAGDDHSSTSMFWWVFAGIFAPEVVVCAAWCQWSEARRLSRQLKDMLARSNTDDEVMPLVSEPGQGSKHEQEFLSSWTLQHSFFVIMGGYQFHPDDVRQDSKTKTGCIIGASTILDLVQRGHANKLPLLSASDLADRSKADNLTKIFACLQGMWLVVQLLGRVLDHLTITELEVNTFAHVLCVVATYAFWMQKPLNVKIPVYVGHKGLESWLLMHTELDNSIAKDLRGLTSTHGTNSTTLRDVRPHDRAMEWGKDKCEECHRNLQSLKDRDMNVLVLGYGVQTSLTDVVNRLLTNNTTRYIFHYVVHYNQYRASSGTKAFSSGGHKRNIVFVNNDDELALLLKFWEEPNKDELIEKYCSDARPSNETRIFASSGPKRGLEALTMLAISSVYGGVHATLWNHHFPTTTERWLWRISSLIVAGSGTFTTFACVLFYIESHKTSGTIKRMFGGYDVLQVVRITMRFFKRIIDHKHWLMEHIRLAYLLLVLFVIGFMALLCLFCRMFLFVEAFISLRSQPASAYETPKWAGWIVHL